MARSAMWNLIARGDVLLSQLQDKGEKTFFEADRLRRGETTPIKFNAKVGAFNAKNRELRKNLAEIRRGLKNGVK